ncbi:MAG: hypothetical protein ACO3G4_00315 [Opitutaceae bacterium]
MRAPPPFRVRARRVLLVSLTFLGATAAAPDKPAKPGKPDREEKRELKLAGGEKPAREPGAETARALTRLREAMRVPDDAEWAVISERIVAVQAAGAGAKDKPKPVGAERATQDALRSAVRDGLPDAEVRLRLARAHELYLEREARLARARAELRAVLTVRQEAVAVLAGLLDPAP